MKDANDNSKNYLAEVDKWKGNYKRCLDELGGKLADERKEVIRVLGERDDANKNLDDARTDYSLLSDEYRELTADKQRLEKKCELLADHLQAGGIVAVDNLSEMADLTAQRDSLINQVETLTAERNALGMERDATESGKASVEAECCRLMNEADAAKAAYDSATEQAFQRIEELTAEKDAKQERIVSANRALVDLTNAHHELTAEKDNFGLRIAELERNNETLSHDLSQEKRLRDASNQRNNELESTVQDLLEQLREVRKEKHILTEQNQWGGERILEMSKTIEAANQVIDFLERKCGLNPRQRKDNCTANDCGVKVCEDCQS